MPPCSSIASSATARSALEQARDVALGHLRHIDRFQRKARLVEQPHAGADGVVAGGHGVHVLCAGRAGRRARHGHHVHRRGLDRVVEQVLELPAHRLADLGLRHGWRFHQLHPVLPGLQQVGTPQAARVVRFSEARERLHLGALLRRGLAHAHGGTADGAPLHTGEVDPIGVDRNRQPIARLALLAAERHHAHPTVR
jgi:hypothetical protein